MSDKIEVLDLFNSISGEVSPFMQGRVCTFLRLAHCNLNCSYCDTIVDGPVQTHNLQEYLLGSIFSFWKKTGCLCITGGEPLLQMNQVKYLLNHFTNVWVETNGTIDFTNIIRDCGIVTDIKLKYMPESFLPFYKLKETDFIKFVVTNPSEIRECLKIQRSLQLGGCKAYFAYSPIFGEFDVQILFKHLERGLLPKTVINTQIHKYVGML